MALSVKEIVGTAAGIAIGYFTGNAYAGAAVAGYFIADDVLGLLIKLPEPPDGLQQGSQAYVNNLRQNQKKLGEVRPYILGRGKMWFPLAAEPYTEYVDHDEYFYAVLDAGVGHVRVTELCIGDRPISAIPGSQVQVMLPGERQALVYPNVYVSPDVKNIELRGGAMNEVTRSIVASFEAGGRMTTREEVGGDGFNPYFKFFGADVGSYITVAGAGANDGTYRITGRHSLGSWLTVDATFTPAADVAASFTFDVIDGDDDSFIAQGIPMTLAGSTLSGPEGSLANVLEGDAIALRGTEANRGAPFTVIATDFDHQLTLDPAPAAETIDEGDVVLLRRTAGPVYGAPVTEKAVRLGLDFVFPRGLGDIKTSDGSVGDETVEIRIEWRPVDDANQPLGPWQSQIETFTDSVVNKPRRFSRYITFGTPIRPEIKVTRITSEFAGEKSDHVNACTWAALRGYLEPREGERWDVDPDGTTVAVRIRASGVLSSIQQASINGICESMIPVWSGGSWSAPQPSRNPWWLAVHFLKDNGRGRITDGDIDLPKIAAAAAAADARGSQCNAIVDAEVLLWETVNAIARTDRGKLVRDPVSRKFVPVRDELMAPALLFADGQNCNLSGAAIDTGSSDKPTGLQVKITDLKTWSTRDDTPVLGTDLRVREVDFFGCTEWAQGWAELQYQWRVLRYRAITVTCNTEMDGLLLAAGQRVLVASANLDWGWGGEVISASGSTLRVSQAPKWVSGAQHYVHLQAPDGSVGARINCTRGADDDVIVLASAPDVTLRTGAGRNTVYVMGRDAFGGTPASKPLQMIVEQVAAGEDAWHAALSLRNDDPRVYDAIPPAPVDPRAPTGSAPALVLDGLTLSVTA